MKRPNSCPPECNSCPYCQDLYGEEIRTIHNIEIDKENKKMKRFEYSLNIIFISASIILFLLYSYFLYISLIR